MKKANFQKKWKKGRFWQLLEETTKLTNQHQQSAPASQPYCFLTTNQHQPPVTTSRTEWKAQRNGTCKEKLEPKKDARNDKSKDLPSEVLVLYIVGRLILGTNPYGRSGTALLLHSAGLLYFSMIFRKFTPLKTSEDPVQIKRALVFFEGKQEGRCPYLSGTTIRDTLIGILRSP